MTVIYIFMILCIIDMDCSYHFLIKITLKSVNTCHLRTPFNHSDRQAIHKTLVPVGR